MLGTCSITALNESNSISTPECLWSCAVIIRKVSNGGTVQPIDSGKPLVIHAFGLASLVNSCRFRVLPTVHAIGTRELQDIKWVVARFIVRLSLSRVRV